MAPADYKVKFKELKSRVGIDDVAYSLGYRLDRKAGVGRYIELVLGEGRDKRDTIIVSNRRDKASQTFFRRDGSKGDVVSFIRENLSSFNVIGLTEWQKIAKVMAQFANMPEPDYDRDRDYVRLASAPQVFDPSRYRVKNLDAAISPGCSLSADCRQIQSRLSLRSFPLCLTGATRISTATILASPTRKPGATRLWDMRSAA